jgi:hypothetical protein
MNSQRWTDDLHKMHCAIHFRAGVRMILNVWFFVLCSHFAKKSKQ